MYIELSILLDVQTSLVAFYVQLVQVHTASQRLHIEPRPGHAIPSRQRIVGSAQAHGKVDDGAVGVDSSGQEFLQPYGACGTRFAAADLGSQHRGQVGCKPGQRQGLQRESDIAFASAGMQGAREIEFGGIIDCQRQGEGRRLPGGPAHITQFGGQRCYLQQGRLGEFAAPVQGALLHFREFQL